MTASKKKKPRATRITVSAVRSPLPGEHVSHWTQEQRDAFDCALTSGATLAYYCSDQWGRPSDGGAKDTVCAPLAVHKAASAVIFQTGLHATVDSPHRWRGCRVWVVALRGVAGREGDNVCASERVVIGEVMPDECLDARVLARISSANLRSADLSSANLRSANLRYANLRFADLRYANLRFADLRFADLRSADLRSADLSFADLRSADLSYANLSSADLSYAGWWVDVTWRAYTLEDAVNAGALNADKAIWK